MTETNEVWRTMRRIVTPYGRFKRIENRCEVGTPDLNYTLSSPLGFQGWIELKIFPRIGKAPSHLTLEQIMWGEAEVNAGGQWHLMGRCNSHWLLYTVVEARKLFEGEESTPVFNISGRFPLVELLRALPRRNANE